MREEQINNMQRGKGERKKVRIKKEKWKESKQEEELTEGTKQKGGHAVAQLVEALLYKPEGRGFDSR
jgi:hypothetical protein